MSWSSCLRICALRRCIEIGEIRMTPYELAYPRRERVCVTAPVPERDPGGAWRPVILRWTRRRLVRPRPTKVRLRDLMGRKSESAADTEALVPSLPAR